MAPVARELSDSEDVIEPIQTATSLMNDVVHDYLTSVDTANGTVTFVANPDTTVTTAGATRLAYNPRSRDRPTTGSLSTAGGEATRSVSN